jgi:7-keto-8-aminopelargonate synthetase-like enzyme
MGSGDLVVHDELMHNSALMGAKLSQATTLSFRHNDLDALERLLGEERAKHKNTMIVVEGLYSMDGDLADLPRLIEIKRKYGAWLMIDEAHSLGVIGSTGLGSAEYHNIDPRDVDIWMGTLSKALGSCGGYIAGKNELIETLKFNAASFVYSVGLSPPIAAAAEVALDVLRAEPQRVRRLQENGLLFLNEAKASGLNTGISEGYAVVSIMIGDILKAVRLSELLLNRGINALPIIYPAVPMKASRLRFFITSEHTSDEIKLAVKITRQEIGNLKGWKNGAKSPSVQLSDNEPKPNMAVSGKC